jgi:hypothetical protein
MTNKQIVTYGRTLSFESENDKEYARKHLIGSLVVFHDRLLDSQTVTAITELVEVNTSLIEAFRSPFSTWRYITQVTIENLVGKVFSAHNRAEAAEYIGKRIEYWSYGEIGEGMGWYKAILCGFDEGFKFSLLDADIQHHSCSRLIRLCEETFADDKPAVNVDVNMTVNVNGKEYTLKEKQ